MLNSLINKIVTTLFKIDINSLLNENIELLSLRTEMVSLQRLLVQSKEANEDKKEQLSILEVATARKDDEIKKLQSIIESQKKEIQDVKNRNNKLCTNVDVLRQRVANLQEAEGELASTNSDLKEENEKLSAQIENITRQVEESRKEANRWTQEKTTLQTKIESAVSSAEELEDRVSDLSAKIVLLDSELQGKENEIAELSAALNEVNESVKDELRKREEVELLLTESRDKNNSLNKIRKELEAEIEEFRNKVSDLGLNQIKDTIQEITVELTGEPEEEIEETKEDTDEESIETIEEGIGETEGSVEEILGDEIENNSARNETTKEEQIFEESISEYSAIKVKNEFEVENESVLEDTEYSNELQVAETLSIPTVYDVIEDKEYDTRDFFHKYTNKDGEEYLMTLRTSLEQAILLNKPHFICSYCRQMVKLCGRKFQRGRISYFAHYRDSEDCPYKTSTNQTADEINARKYSLVQESLRHRKLKALIAEALSTSKSQEMGIDNVVCEKRINSNIPYLNWRRPDICADWGDRRLVFELQLSTTFLSVVVDRDIFYRLNKYFIIWVFNFDDNQEYVNLSNLMCKDIYYSNKRNVFIFDEEAQRRSEEEQELVLRCRWLDEEGKWSKDEFISLSDLKFDEEKCKPYYYDADKDFFERHPEALDRRLKTEHSREYILSALMERQRKEEEHKQQWEIEKNGLQGSILSNNKSVELFSQKGKYGYKFEGKIIIEPKYTSAEDIQKNGYAQVGFNRKIGLVRQDGKEIIPVEYKTIKVVNSDYGVIVAYYKNIYLWIEDICIMLVEGFDKKEQQINIVSQENRICCYIKTNEYDYYYTHSYYVDHPIRHKKHIGVRDALLFSLITGENQALIFAKNKLYISSNKRGIALNGEYSELIGIKNLYAAKSRSNGCWDIIDLKGYSVVDIAAEKLIPTESKYVIFRNSQSEQLGIADCCGNKLSEPKFNKLFYLRNDVFAFSNDKNWGLCDQFGNIIKQETYSYIRNSEDGRIRVSTTNEVCIVWNEEKSEPEFSKKIGFFYEIDDLGDIFYTEKDYENFHVRQSGDLYFIYSKLRKLQLEKVYIECNVINENTIILKDMQGICCIYTNDSFKFEGEYKQIEYLLDGMYKYRLDDKWYIGNIDGIINNIGYDSIEVLDNKHFKVSNHTYYTYQYLYGIINEKGEQILPLVFQEIGTFENNIAQAKRNGNEGFISLDGVEQENLVQSYGKISLWVSFGIYVFKNEDSDEKSIPYHYVEDFGNGFLKVVRQGESKSRLFSLNQFKDSEECFNEVRVLVNNYFVVRKNDCTDEYYLYKEFSPLFDSCFNSIQLLDNGLLSLQEDTLSSWDTSSKYCIATLDGELLTNFIIDRIVESGEESIKVVINEKEGLLDLSGREIEERTKLSNGLILLTAFGKCGIESATGELLISLQNAYQEIEVLNLSLLKVFNGKRWSLFDSAGKQLTDFIYDDITITEEGSIAAIKNRVEGRLDEQGQELPILTSFGGGYIQSVFGDCSILDESKTLTLYVGNSKIEYLENNYFVIRKGEKMALANMNEIITDFEFDSISGIGNGFFKVSKTIPKKIRIRESGYGYRGNPYTYYQSIIQKNKRFGIITESGKTVIRCKYISISEFDPEDSIILINEKNEQKKITRKSLELKKNNSEELIVGKKYVAKVKFFMPIGLIVKIGTTTYVVHRKHLYKDLKKFSKGDFLEVTFTGYDYKGNETWESQEHNIDVDLDTESGDV